jgi:hypothetical protein
MPGSLLPAVPLDIHPYDFTRRKARGSFHCPFSCWNFMLLSIKIWPSSASEIANRSNGRGVGPSKLIPLL